MLEADVADQREHLDLLLEGCHILLAGIEHQCEGPQDLMFVQQCAFMARLRCSAR
jgi:hypothetical protein